MPPLRRDHLQRYGIAAVAFVMALVCTALWHDFLHQAPFGLFFAAVAVAAGAGGLFPGLAVALGGVIASVLLADRAADAVLPSLVFLAVAALISCLAEQRRCSRQALEENAAVLDVLFTKAPVGLGLWDRQLRFVRINDALAQINGLPPDAHLGKTVQEVLPDLDAGVLKAFRHVADTGEALLTREASGETPAAPGQRRYWTISYYPVRLRGEVVGIGAVCEEITARRQTEMALRASEEEVRAMFELTGVGQVRADPTGGRFLRVNRRLTELTGYSADELLAMTSLDLTHPDDRPHDLALLRQVVRGEQPGWSNEKRYVRKDGSVVWVHVTGTLTHDEDGRPLRAVAIVQDVHARHQAEQALREGEERLRMALDAARMVAWDWNVRSDRVYRSLSAVEILGADLDVVEGSGREFLDRVHPEDRAGVQRALTAALDGTGEYDLEFRLRHPDGVTRWVHDRARVIRDAAGQPVRMTGVMWDVSDRVAVEEALRVSRERLDLVVRFTELGLWYCDLPLDRLVWSDKCKEHFGLPPDATVTLDTFYERLHPEDRERTRQGIEEAISRYGAFDCVYRTVAPEEGGRLRWIRAIGRAFQGAGDQPSHFDGVTVDVTEQKHAEEALKTADRRKDEFLAMLAHELRNPLAPIRTGLHILNLTGDNDPELAEVREMMGRQVEQLVRLVDDLLDVSRIMRGKIELRKETVELAVVVSRAVETVRPLLDARGHTLSVSLPSLPVRLNGDLVRLAQVVGNLLTNAAKYTESPGRIWLTAENDSDEAVLRVRDTGVGIAAELLPHVFELFVQADPTAARSQGGLGIGLTLVKRLVEMHGGSVQALSAGLGQGSEFVLRLPVLPGREPVARDGHKGHSSAGESRRKILVVDDNEDSAQSLALFLRLGGHEVRAAHDGPSALREARSFRPEVVLLDIGMPGMDGHEVARRLRQEPGLSRVLLVAMTGYGQHEDRRRSWEAGFDHHLVKPVDPDALRNLIGVPDGKG